MTKFIFTILLLCISSFQVSAFAQGDFTESNPCLKKLQAQSVAVES